MLSRFAFLSSRRLLVGAALAAASGLAVAQAISVEPPRDVLQLSASGSVEVQQDLLVLTLATTREGSDAASVQKELRQALDAALQQARADAAPEQMEVRTGDFGLHPRYDKEGAITGWQGRAELVLSGRDFGRITGTAGRIRTLAISRVAFDLSRQARQRVEGQAEAEAIAAFKARAEALARGFGFSGYSLREVSVNSNESSPGPRPRVMAMQAKGAAYEMDAPVPVEAGKSQVMVTISGSVQLR
ncbi:Predicted secreted protein [Oryzisolibacter propanilivorax]|uniref:Predicted secreted protein n=2 Tax=Oryzisolibacter propanilivorax TaxID=1527607 RepID=A0A1G9PGR8_9BURK|nr:SIMPL domain-containing protein [Oryzisolibacter propanilivorax]SDL97691.1 Predicted secreted protein [Oryzisolibacter propanilivorax]